MPTGHAVSGDMVTVAQCCDQLLSSPRYAHYGRIPARMWRCLVRFGVDSNESAVLNSLRIYYLFVGLCDDILDDNRGPLDGAWLLEMLFSEPAARERAPCGHSGVAPLESIAPQLRLLCKAADELQIQGHFHGLLSAVRQERHCNSMKDYVAARKMVGRLTAKISYLLIAHHLERPSTELCDFFCEVGEAGCLVDSAVDLRADWKAGSLGFRPTLLDKIRLHGSTAQLAARLAWRHPGMANIFIEGIVDTVTDRTADRCPSRGPVPLTAT